MTRSPSARRQPTIPVLTLITILTAIIAIFTLDPNHDWGDDFALYIMHAMNLVHGMPYHATLYIQNPQYDMLGPASYPPGLPAILAVPYALAGLDFFYMKLVLYLFFLLATVCIFVYFRRYVSPPAAAVLALAVLLNPFNWQFRQYIWPESPFLFFMFLFMVLHTIPLSAQSRGAWVGRILLTGAVLYCACAVRSIGIVLAVAIVVLDLVRSRRPSWQSCATLLVFGVLYVLQALTLGGTGNYSIYVDDISVRSIVTSVLVTFYAGYYYVLGMATDDGVLLKGFAALCLWGLASFGLLSRLLGWTARASDEPLTDRLLLHDVVFGIYLCVLAIMPATAGGRYLMPIVPILLLYAYQGGSEILGRVGLSERLAAMALVGVFGVIYSVAFLRAGEPEIAVGPAAKESTEMFAYVREHTPSDAVLVFRKPRVLALLGERAATIWPDGAAIGDSWCYFDEVGASYLIVTKPESGLETPGLFRALADAGAERVFENGQFVILKGLPGCDRPRGGEGAG